MEQVRSFVAIELPDGLKRALARLQDEVKSGNTAPVKWVDPYSIHLTLKFLGNVGTDKIGGITAALEGAARGMSPFHLESGGLGAFPGWKRVQVVWVGMGGEIDCLSRLQRRVESGLAPLGFAPESRAFTPHLTLARVRDQATPAERQSLGQLIEGAGLETVYRIDVEAIHLMRSQLTREGAVYSRLSSIRLG
jgi:2'-5' RNA ligase